MKKTLSNREKFKSCLHSVILFSPVKGHPFCHLLNREISYSECEHCKHYEEYILYSRQEKAKRQVMAKLQAIARSQGKNNNHELI